MKSMFFYLSFFLSMMVISTTTLSTEHSTVFNGDVIVPNPWNIAVGFKFTDEKCSISIREVSGGLQVISSFWNGEKYAARDAIRGRTFYLGEYESGKAFILQTHDEKPVALTLTGLDADTILDKRGERKSRKWQRECLISPNSYPSSSP